MANVQLVCDGTPGLCAGFAVQALDNTGKSWPASGTATIDNYTYAFVVALGSNDFQILPKVKMSPGDPTVTVNVTFAMTDTASGNALPNLVVSADLVAPTGPGQEATHLAITAGPGVGTGSDMVDPGTATISISLT